MPEAERFRKMEIIERAELLLEHGQMLMSRSESCYIITLYRIRGFFAEVWYCLQDSGIHMIETIDPEDIINLYEDDIDISDLNR